MTENKGPKFLKYTLLFGAQLVELLRQMAQRMVREQGVSDTRARQQLGIINHTIKNILIAQHEASEVPIVLTSTHARKNKSFSTAIKSLARCPIVTRRGTRCKQTCWPGADRCLLHHAKAERDAILKAMMDAEAEAKVLNLREHYARARACSLILYQQSVRSEEKA